jgi:hypothetical protein
MARAAKRREPAVTFKHSAMVEVRRPKFKAFASLHQLDLPKLARADLTTIELGYLETECCQQLVKAIIRKGMVSEIQVETCPPQERFKPSPELKKLFDAALKRVAKAKPRPPKLPLSITAMMENLGGNGGITVITCVQICLFGWCISCCQQPSGDVICGRLTIDGTSGPYPGPQ